MMQNTSIAVLAMAALLTGACTRQTPTPTPPNTPEPNLRYRLTQALSVMTDSNKTATSLVIEFNRTGKLDKETTASILEYNERIAHFAKSSLEILGSASTEDSKISGVRRLLERVIISDALAERLKAENLPEGVRTALASIQALVRMVQSYLDTTPRFGDPTPTTTQRECTEYDPCVIRSGGRTLFWYATKTHLTIVHGGVYWRTTWDNLETALLASVDGANWRKVDSVPAAPTYVCRADTAAPCTVLTPVTMGPVLASAH